MAFYAVVLVVSIMMLVFSYKKELEYSHTTCNNTRIDEEEDYDQDTILRIDQGIAYFFFFELIIRFVVCPHKLRFLKDWFSFIDIVGIIPWAFIQMVISVSDDGADETLEEHLWIYIYIRVAGVVRVIRLLGFARHYLAYRVFLITIWESRREIALLLALYITGATFFASATFFAEEEDYHDFPTMASGLWWAMITMSTVGYGDMYPRTALGKSIGVFCAFSGLIATALPVAVIATNYNAIYQTAETRTKIRHIKREEDRRQSKI